MKNKHGRGVSKKASAAGKAKLDGKGPDEEQAWQGCEQEGKRRRQGQTWRLDRCSQEGTCCLEDQRLPGHQEGHATLRQGQGVLQLRRSVSND